MNKKFRNSEILSICGGCGDCKWGFNLVVYLDSMLYMLSKVCMTVWNCVLVESRFLVLDSIADMWTKSFANSRCYFGLLPTAWGKVCASSAAQIKTGSGVIWKMWSQHSWLSRSTVFRVHGELTLKLLRSFAVHVTLLSLFLRRLAPRQSYSGHCTRPKLDAPQIKCPSC